MGGAPRAVLARAIRRNVSIVKVAPSRYIQQGKYNAKMPWALQLKFGGARKKHAVELRRVGGKRNPTA
jgi:hypothetical protein